MDHSYLAGEYPGDYNVCQKQVRSLLVALRREGFTRYVGGWEFQKRGAPHVNLVTPYYIPHLFLKEHWFNIVGSGQQAHFHQGVHLIDIRSSRGQRFKWYIAGYIGKESQKVAPDGFKNMRRWGFWSRDYAGPSEQFQAGVTFSDLDGFLGAVVDRKNAVLSELNETKGKSYHLAEKKRMGLSYRDGAPDVKQLLEGLEICKLPGIHF